jgi:hypothetical protein
VQAQSHVGLTVRDLDAGYPLELVEIAYVRPGGHAAGIAHYLATRPPAPATPSARATPSVPSPPGTPPAPPAAEPAR